MSNKLIVVKVALIIALSTSGCGYLDPEVNESVNPEALVSKLRVELIEGERKSVKVAEAILFEDVDSRVKSSLADALKEQAKINLTIVQILKCISEEKCIDG